MEAVGARLGRSSARYGPTTVFSGPVRKWKKKWVHVAPPYSASNGSRDRDRIQSSQSANGSNSNNGSHVVLYKWTPIPPRENCGATDETTPVKDDGVEEPPKRKLKFIPIALFEEQNNEALGHSEEETEAGPSRNEQASKSKIADKKPDMNDTPMKDMEDTDGEGKERQDLNESTLDLSLGLTSHDDGNGLKTDGE